jgi:AcrR family transcriptional regulator
MSKPRVRNRYSSGPTRGEQRRERLLQALEDLLASRPFAAIEVGDIARSAGLSRSAFYFYFPSKAAAVGAMLGDVFGEISDVLDKWTELGDSVAARRREVYDSFERVVAIWRQHAPLMAAMFDAASTDAEVRAMFEGHIDSFVDGSAARIRHERAVGEAPDGPDPEALARVLVGMNVKALERDMRAITSGAPADADLPRVLAFVWGRVLYDA